MTTRVRKIRKRNRAPSRRTKSREQNRRASLALAEVRAVAERDQARGEIMEWMLRMQNTDPVDRACAEYVHGSLKPMSVCGCGELKMRRMPFCPDCREALGAVAA